MVLGENGEDLSLSQRLDELRVHDQQYVLTYRSQRIGKRDATLEIRSGTIAMRAPKLQSPWLKEQGVSLLTMHAVEVREVNPPAGVKPLHWVLLTSVPMVTFSDAIRVVEHYEKRWIVEEFHKALKTGCRVEERQYKTSARLENITGLLSVIAVRLLQIRSAARHTPEQPAANLIPMIWIRALSILRPHAKIETVQQFYRQLGGLGGHLLRKSDGEPGWITIWRGYDLLHLAIQTIRGYNKRCG
jgi:hypothetical protein